MKPNIIGLISVLLAFLSIVLPWYSESAADITVNYSLLDFVNFVLGFGVAGLAWLILIALALIVVGGFFGLIGSFVIGKKGKSLLSVGMILVLLSPIIFAMTIVSVGLPLFGSYADTNFYVSFGFFLTFIAAFLMSFSVRKHPMEARKR